jgi:undecaprenyl-diphosphatase
VLVAGLTAAMAEVYDAVVEHEGVAGLDRPVLDQAIAWRTPLTAELVTWFTHLGGFIGMSIIATVVTLAMVWRWRSPTPAILMVIATAGSLTFTAVGKAIVGRARPPLSAAVPPYEYAFSFPSGHALNSTVIAGMVAYLVVRRRRSRRAAVVAAVIAGAWSIAMGLSRVYLGHHWLTDVVVGWLLGLAWLTVLITAHHFFLAVYRARLGRRSFAYEVAADVGRHQAQDDQRYPGGRVDRRIAGQGTDRHHGQDDHTQQGREPGEPARAAGQTEDRQDGQDRQGTSSRQQRTDGG